MPQITVTDLCKTYHIAEHRPGLSGAIARLVHRRYRDIVALDGISFLVEPGELVGYIGPNGADKSTTVKILGGILCGAWAASLRALSFWGSTSPVSPSPDWPSSAVPACSTACRYWGE